VHAEAWLAPRRLLDRWEGVREPVAGTHMPANDPPHIFALMQQRDRLALEVALKRRQLAVLERPHQRMKAQIDEAWRLEREQLLLRLREQQAISDAEMRLLGRDR
jgi:hypothetical protein